MNKNAYEIRLEVLQMAHSDAYQAYQLRLDANRDNMGNLVESNVIAFEPKTSDILTRAEELYKFVSSEK